MAQNNVIMDVLGVYFKDFGKTVETLVCGRGNSKAHAEISTL